jgi:hypothetical protein
MWINHIVKNNTAFDTAGNHTWHRMKKYCYFLLLVLILVPVIIYAANRLHQQPDFRKGTTMKEAYQLAYEEVMKINPQVQLFKVSSHDSMETEDRSAGKHGVRRYWYVQFAIPNSTQYWIAAVNDQKVTDMIKVMGISYDQSKFIGKEEFLMDSKDALKIAQKEYKLKPGDVWAIGYHFSMSKETGDIIIDVIGRDQADRFARVFVDAKAKKAKGAIHKVYKGGGIYDGNNYKGLVTQYDIYGIRNELNAYNNPALVAWGIKLLNIIQYKPVILYKNRDEDQWITISYPYDIQNILPVAENELFVVCDRNLYRYHLSSKTNTKLLEIADENDWIMNSGFYEGKIYIFTKTEINISSDLGNTWDKVSLPEAEDVRIISYDFNEDKQLCISRNNKIYCLKDSRWVEALTSKEFILDFKCYQQSLLYSTDKSMKASDLVTGKTSTINPFVIIMKLISVGDNSFYAISTEGKLYKLEAVGESTEWKMTEVYTNEENGFITDILQLDADTWYYTTSSRAEWVTFNLTK